VKNQALGALVTCRKMPTTETWSERFRIYCRVIDMQQIPTAKQSASKFRKLLLQIKERTWANCNIIIAYLNKPTSCKPSYMVTPNCLRSVGCQIVSVLTFLAGASATWKEGACETLRVCAERLGGLAVTTFPEALRSGPDLQQGFFWCRKYNGCLEKLNMCLHYMG